MTDDAGVERYLKQIYTPYLKAQHLGEAEMSERINVERKLLQEKQPEVSKLWEEMTKADSVYPVEYRGVNVNPHDFFDGLKQQHAGEVEARLGNIQYAPPSSRVPFSEVPVTDRLEAPESMRLRRALTAMGFGDIAKAEPLFKWNKDTRRYELQRNEEMKVKPERLRALRLVIDLMQQFDALDPAARCKSTHLMVDDAKDFAAHYKSEGGIKVIHFELGNLNGLNSVNPDLGDAVLRETGKYIHDGLMQHNHGLDTAIMDHVYHEGGGKFKVLVPPDYPDANIKAVAGYVNAQMDKCIRGVAIMDFSALTYARPRTDGKVADLRALSIASRDAVSCEKLGHLRERLDNMPKNLGNTITMMSEIPHPKDASKSMTFKNYSAIISVDDLTNSDSPNVIDRDKVADALHSVTERAEVAFNTPTSASVKKG